MNIVYFPHEVNSLSSSGTVFGEEMFTSVSTTAHLLMTRSLTRYNWRV